MRLSVIRLGVVLVPACLVASAVCAQPAPAPAATQASQPPQLRSQMSIMEGILERAVGEGIRGAVAQMPDVLGPWMLGTPARVRGFKLEGYGVFFDVEVPALPMTITWSLQVINRNNEVVLVNDLNSMRQVVANVPDEKTRVTLARIIDRLEAHVSGAPLSEAPVRSATAVPAVRPSPGDVYTSEVQRALVNAMLEEGTRLQIAPDDWLTVAACDSQGSGRIAPGEPQLLTLYLSIKGKDLVALRAGQITREEAAKRVVVKNY